MRCEYRRPPLRRRTVSALEIVRATRQDLDLRTYDDIVVCLLEEYAASRGIPRSRLLLDDPARSDSCATPATSGKTGKN